jgi:hypothetical protein
MMRIKILCVRIACSRRKLYVGVVDEQIQMMPSLINQQIQLNNISSNGSNIINSPQPNFTGIARVLPPRDGNNSFSSIPWNNILEEIELDSVEPQLDLYTIS